MFPPEGGSVMYSLRGPMGTAWRVVTNNYWSYPDMFYSSGTINHDILPSIAQVHAIPNDSVGKEQRTGKAYFIFTNNFGFADTVARYYSQPNSHLYYQR